MRAPGLILNVGSLNIDFVYRVPHFVRAGETLSAGVRAQHPGGKGLNQSLAIARGGGRVRHFGAIGHDGAFLREILEQAGVGTRHLEVCDGASGHAIIQVTENSENAILLHGGANHSLKESALSAALDALPAGSMVLTQNETNLTGATVRAARSRGLRVAWNPAPIADNCFSVPLDAVDILVVNEVEGAALARGNADEPFELVEALAARMAGGVVVLTLGARGSIASVDGRLITVPAERVPHPVDTTAAGDTFIGYFLTAVAEGASIEASLHLASSAAALSVQREGAAPSIPERSELDSTASPGGPAVRPAR